MSQINRVRKQDDLDDVFLAVNTRQEMLEAAPAFERHDHDRDDMNDTAIITDIDRPIFVAPQVERDGYSTVDLVELTSETLTGTSVYDVADEDIGEVGTLLGLSRFCSVSLDGMIAIKEHKHGTQTQG